MFIVVMAILGFLVAGAIVIGIVVLHNNQAIETAEHRAKVTCERTKQFAPYLATYFRTQNVMPEQALKEYEAGIPKDCS